MLIGLLLFINETGLLDNLGHDKNIGACTQGNGYSVGRTSVDPHLAGTIVENHLGVEDSVLQFINANFFQPYAETMGKTYKQIVGDGSRRNDALE